MTSDHRPMGMTVCSGIGAPEQAAPWIDWRYQSEIEPFPSAVLAHRFPDAVNLGDMTKFQEWPDADVDVLVGGTPCQSFSVAGLRKGLDDPRGNLMLTFLAIARRYRPRWILWENVPGVLSSNGGRDFGSFLGGLGECGYGWAYRVLDAQYVRTPRFPHAVPQRRRRVFVVGCLGDWRRAAAVLFEPEGLQGHPPPRREAGKAAPTSPSRSTDGGGLGTDFDCDGGLICATDGQANAAFSEGYANTLAATNEPPYIAAAVASTLNAAFGSKQGLEDQHVNAGCPLYVAHALRGESLDASEDGTGRGTPLVPVGYSIMPMNSGKDYKARPTDVAQPLMAGGPVGGNQGGDFIAQPVAFPAEMSGTQAASTPDLSPALSVKHTMAVAIQERAVSENPDAGPDGKGYREDGASYTLEARSVPQAVAFAQNQRGELRESDVSLQLTTGGGKPAEGYPAVRDGFAVRRLTPTECERLMGMPDGWTRIPYRNKPADQCPDGPRYKALGNSIAVNCLELIFERMRAVERGAA